MSIFRPTDPPRPLRSETGCPTDRPSRPPATARDPTRVTRPTDSPTPSRRRLAGSEPPTDRPSQKPPRDAESTFNFASPDFQNPYTLPLNRPAKCNEHLKLSNFIQALFFVIPTDLINSLTYSRVD